MDIEIQQVQYIGADDEFSPILVQVLTGPSRGAYYRCDCEPFEGRRDARLLKSFGVNGHRSDYRAELV